MGELVPSRQAAPEPELLESLLLALDPALYLRVVLHPYKVRQVDPYPEPLHRTYESSCEKSERSEILSN